MKPTKEDRLGSIQEKLDIQLTGLDRTSSLRNLERLDDAIPEKKEVNNMPFIVILGIVTLAIAASAAFFSIIGIGYLFSSMFVSAVIMAASLEAGKLVTASFLYRYNKIAPKRLKYTLIIFLSVLMFITSIGVYGYLSKGYKETSLQMELIDQRIEQIETNISGTQERLDSRISRLDKEVKGLPNNWVSKRLKLNKEIKSLSRKRESLIDKLLPELEALSKRKLEYKAHIGPISYIADTFGIIQDKAAFYAILILIAVFDPLAIALTFAFAIALKNNS